MRARPLLLLCALGWCGCPDPEMPIVDGGMPVPDAGAPTLIALPDWGSCAEGWIATDVEGASVCVPPARVTCTGAMFQPVGSAACEPIDPCGAGSYRTERLTDRSYVFVDATAPIGGDGSEAIPFRALDDALRSGATGILLAAGDYTIGAPLPVDVDVRGLCTERTRLIANAGRPAILVGMGQRASLTGLTVTGAGIGPAARGILVLDRVLLEDLDGWGAGVNGGHLEANRVLVRAPRPSPGSAVGLGLSLIDGASAQLTDVVVEDAYGVGIQLEGASMVGERVVVQRIASEVETGLHGGGISAVATSNLTLGDSLITDVHNFGVLVQSDSMATADRVVILGVTSSTAASDGTGFHLSNSTGTLDHLLIEGSTGGGLVVFGTANVHASDVVVRSIALLEDFAGGVTVSQGTLALDRALILDTAFIAVTVRGGRLTASDLTVNRVAAARGAGTAIASSDGATTEVRRFRFSDLFTMGAVTVGAGASLTLSEGSISGVKVTPEYDIGRGAEAHTGGHLVLRDVTIDDVVETGIVAFAGTEAGTIIEGTSIEMTDVHLSRIAERSCAATTCPTEAGGTGVSALFGATISATDLYVTGAPLCGVQVFDRASLDVTSGAIEESAIGACVQIEGYDLARIVDGVRFVANERNVETTSVYVPRVGPTL